MGGTNQTRKQDDHLKTIAVVQRQTLVVRTRTVEMEVMSCHVGGHLFK